jgi:predicted ATPase
MNRFVVISGCSGGGKSTLLAELGRRGHAIVEEPGRRIVQEEISRGGSALPWLDMAAFLRRAIAVSLADRDAASVHPGWFFSTGDSSMPHPVCRH